MVTILRSSGIYDDRLERAFSFFLNRNVNETFLLKLNQRLHANRMIHYRAETTSPQALHEYEKRTVSEQFLGRDYVIIQFSFRQDFPVYNGKRNFPCDCVRVLLLSLVKTF